MASADRRSREPAVVVTAIAPDEAVAPREISTWLLELPPVPLQHGRQQRVIAVQHMRPMHVAGLPDLPVFVPAATHQVELLSPNPQMGLLTARAYRRRMDMQLLAHGRSAVDVLVREQVTLRGDAMAREAAGVLVLLAANDVLPLRGCPPAYLVELWRVAIDRVARELQAGGSVQDAATAAHDGVSQISPSTDWGSDERPDRPHHARRGA